MAEHLGANQEQQFIDKTIERSGIIESNGSGCQWELHTLPEYADDDEKLSVGVIGQFTQYLLDNGYKDVTANLVEGYKEEPVGKEHYRLALAFGNGSENEKMKFFKDYSADTGEHGIVKGRVKVVVGLLSDSNGDHKEVAGKLADIYIRNMENTYTDWKNDWNSQWFVRLSSGTFRVKK